MGAVEMFEGEHVWNGDLEEVEKYLCMCAVFVW